MISHRKDSHVHNKWFLFDVFDLLGGNKVSTVQHYIYFLLLFFFCCSLSVMPRGVFPSLLASGFKKCLW